MQRSVLLLFLVLTLALPAAQAQQAKSPAYALNAKELTLDCQKLTGRMKLRIMQLRDSPSRKETSSISRGAQSVASVVNGATTHGVDPRADDARDRAMLEAYNARLKEKNCKTLDVEAELKGQPTPPAAKPAKNPAIKPAAPPPDAPQKKT